MQNSLLKQSTLAKQLVRLLALLGCEQYASAFESIWQ